MSEHVTETQFEKSAKTVPQKVGNNEMGLVVFKSDFVGVEQDSSDPITFTSFGPRGPLIYIKPKKKIHIAEIHDKLKIPFAPSYFSALLHPQSNPNLLVPFNSPASSSKAEDLCSKFLGGSVLYCDSTTDTDVNQGNKRIWKSIEGMPVKVWKSIKDLGIKGEEDNEVFEGIVWDNEVREQNC